MKPVGDGAKRVRTRGLDDEISDISGLQRLTGKR
jgi:hypothetical protein